MLASQAVGDLPDRITLANEQPPLQAGKYVLVVLNRALRAEDNPVIESAIAHATTLTLPLVVYSELDESAPYASDRLFYFALGTFRELARDLRAKGIQCVQRVKLAEEDGLRSLLPSAAVVYTDEDHTVWDRARQQRLLKLATQSVFFVGASTLVPMRCLPKGTGTTPAFRKAHGLLRDKYAALRKEASAQIGSPPTELKIALPNEHNFADYDESALADFVSQCNIDHSIPLSKAHPPTQAELSARITTLKKDILARYKWIRNNAALEHSTSQLSPYLHFGMLSPHQLFAEIEAAEVPKTYTWKFRDEFLTWREWSHYQAFHNPKLHEYAALPDDAKKTLEAHADDPRPELQTRENLIQGNTPDATWNAAQREWLTTGWLHNNLRMYWAKQILRFTKTPQAAWETACYLNDALSLDGRDPATYASMRWAFGDAKPGYSEKAIYGWVAPKSDRAILKRKGMQEWIAQRQPH